MIKISRSNTNWFTKGEESVNLSEAANILKGFLGWLNMPVYHINIYVEKRKITFTAIVIRPRNGPRGSMKFEGSIAEIRELQKLLPRSEKVRYHPYNMGSRRGETTGVEILTEKERRCAVFCSI